VLKGLDLEIQSLQKEQKTIRKSVEGMEARVERSPKREQEMISLTRDYDNLKRSYDDLLKKKLEADVSQNLEKRQKGAVPSSTPNLPEPFVPNRPKLFGIAVLAPSSRVRRGDRPGNDRPVRPGAKGSATSPGSRHNIEHPDKVCQKVGRRRSWRRPDHLYGRLSPRLRGKGPEPPAGAR
jgi:hypothetical protein